MMCDLADAVAALESYEGRAVLVLGDGGAFCSGIDLRQAPVLAPAVGAAINALMASVTQRLYHSHLVTAAVVERFAIGAGADLIAGALQRTGQKGAEGIVVFCEENAAHGGSWVRNT